MSSSQPVALPPAFEALAPFVDTWGRCQTQEERFHLRVNSAMTELEAFYGIVMPRRDAIFELLDRHPLGSLPEPEALLYRIVLGLTEVAPAVEIFGQPNVPHAPRQGDLRIRWCDQPEGTSA
jgi:hypothetical protein